MNNISAVDTQSIVNRIADLSASGRVHKKPLAEALKEVRSAVKKLADFQPEQARKIAEDMQKAVTVLSTQKSNMEEKKAGSLHELASRLRTCFSRSMEKMNASIASSRQKQADLPAMAQREEIRIENKHQSKIDALKNYLGEICQSTVKYDQLLRQRKGLDATFDALLMNNGFSESEKWTALTHYETPTTKEVKGLTYHSSDDVFSDKEARRRFGGAINKHVEYGRRQYVELTVKVYTPANAKGKAWVEFRELAEQRRFISKELYRHPAHSQSMRQHAARLEIKAEKAARTGELRTLQTIVAEESAHLQADIVKTRDEFVVLQSAHDALLPDRESTAL